MLDAFRWRYNVERPHQSLHNATPAEVYKASPLAGRADDGKPVPPRTLHVNSNGVISYCRRKINVGMHLAGRAVQATEDRGIVFDLPRPPAPARGPPRTALHLPRIR